MSAPLHLSHLDVELGGASILRGLELELAAGEYGVVLGPSGAGKSTLLRAIAGIVPARGEIRLGERTLCGPEQIVPPEERELGFLFQSLALWPHMSVQGHLEYALKGRRVPRSEWAAAMDSVLEPLGISDLRKRRPSGLSGGECQRLALARALVVKPGLLLLDEPTSSVDPQAADDVRTLLRELCGRFGITVLHVTHDQGEALGLADRLFVLKDGKILQGGAPRELWERPSHPDVARFLGHGGLLPGTAREDGRAETPLGLVDLEGEGASGPVWLLVRPDDLAVASEGVAAEVRAQSYAGEGYRLRLEVAGHELRMRSDAPVDDPTLPVTITRPLWVVAARKES